MRQTIGYASTISSVIIATWGKNLQLRPARTGCVICDTLSLDEGDGGLDQGVVGLLVVPQVAFKNALQSVTRRYVLLRHLCGYTGGRNGRKGFESNRGPRVCPRGMGISPNPGYSSKKFKIKQLSLLHQPTSRKPPKSYYSNNVKYTPAHSQVLAPVHLSRAPPNGTKPYTPQRPTHKRRPPEARTGCL